MSDRVVGTSGTRVESEARNGEAARNRTSAPLPRPRSPAEQAVDLLFYAPLGLLFNADELIPQLVKRGRQQVALARLFGKFAVERGRSEAAKAADRVQQHAASTLETLAARGGEGVAGPQPTPATAPATDPTPPPDRPRTYPPASSGPSTGARRGAAATNTDILAIPDYDSLSASQVVPRLAGLADDELEAVRSYEAAHRHRKTILNRVAQLQAG